MSNAEFLFPNQLNDEQPDRPEAPEPAPPSVSEELNRRADLPAQAAQMLEGEIANWMNAESQNPGSQEPNALTRIGLMRDGHLIRRDLLQAAAANQSMHESLSAAIANLSNLVAGMVTK